MEIDIKGAAIAGILLLGLGYGTGRYLQPAKVEVKTQEVVKEVETKKDNVVTETHTVTEKDGTAVTDTKTVDLSVTQKQETETVKTDTTVTNVKPQWRVAVLGAIDTHANPRLDYGLSVEKRLAGPIIVGVQGYQNGLVGLSVGLEF